MQEVEKWFHFCHHNFPFLREIKDYTKPWKHNNWAQISAHFYLTRCFEMGYFYQNVLFHFHLIPIWEKPRSGRCLKHYINLMASNITRWTSLRLSSTQVLNEISLKFTEFRLPPHSKFYKTPYEFLFARSLKWILWNAFIQ